MTPVGPLRDMPDVTRSFDDDSPDLTDSPTDAARPKSDADPVTLSDGALVVSHTDVKFSGAARPLVFERKYVSKSDARSILGSNWTHNYDMRVVALTPENTPDWAPKWCLASWPITNCVHLVLPNGGERLYMRNPGDTNELFYPEAGAVDTLKRHPDGWSLHAPDGARTFFNGFGYPSRIEDRFGNPTFIEWQATPTYKVYRRYCDPGSTFAYAQNVNATNVLAAATNPSHQAGAKTSVDIRLCNVLGSIFGDQVTPHVGKEGHAVIEDRNGTPVPTLQLPSGDGPAKDPFPHNDAFNGTLRI